MDKEMLEKWESNKNNLRKKLECLNDAKIEDLSYSHLVRYVIDEILNDGIKNSRFLSSKLKVVDYGDYQGTIIFIFTKNIYQPSLHETYYTFIEYGSCSGCDILINIICNYFDIKYVNQSAKHKCLVNDLMILCLHIFQHINSFEGSKSDDQI